MDILTPEFFELANASVINSVKLPDRNVEVYYLDEGTIKTVTAKCSRVLEHQYTQYTLLFDPTDAEKVDRRRINLFNYLYIDSDTQQKYSMDSYIDRTRTVIGNTTVDGVSYYGISFWVRSSVFDVYLSFSVVYLANNLTAGDFTEMDAAAINELLAARGTSAHPEISDSVVYTNYTDQVKAEMKAMIKSYFFMNNKGDWEFMKKCFNLDNLINTMSTEDTFRGIWVMADLTKRWNIISNLLNNNIK